MMTTPPRSTQEHHVACAVAERECMTDHVAPKMALRVVYGALQVDDANSRWAWGIGMQQISNYQSSEHPLLALQRGNSIYLGQARGHSW